MLPNLFLRDEGDPVGDPTLGKPDPNVVTQGDKIVDPSKKDEGLSAIEKVELETLRKEKETYEKRLTDTQTGFHDARQKLADMESRINALAQPKKKDDFADDAIIGQIDAKIEHYHSMNWDTAALDIQRSIRIDQLDSRKSLAEIEAINRQSMDLGRFLSENPDATDLTGAGKRKAELESRGLKVDTETAYYYNLGKNYKPDFEKAVQAEVTKRLEAKKKGEGARGAEGEFIEPPGEEADEKSKNEYLDFLHNPSGVNIQ